MSVGDVIKDLANVVGMLGEIEEMEKSKNYILDLLKANRMPYYSKRVGEFGYECYEMITIITSDGEKHECPLRESIHYTDNIDDSRYGYNREGVGIVDFIISLIANGKSPRKIIVEGYDSESEEGWYYEVEFDEIMMRIVVKHMLQKIAKKLNGQLKKVKAYGNSAHIVLPKSYIGRQVLIIPL